MVVWSLMGLALAAEPERIVVWADPFKRWDDTRWSVQTDLVMVDDAPLHVDGETSLDARHVVIDAVIHCQRDYTLGPNRIEASCRIEDLGLQVQVRAGDPAAREDETLQAIDDWITGTELQIQSTARGSVANIDLENVLATHRKERQTLESTRDILARILAPFHLKWPAGGPQAGAMWVEYGSALFDLPSGVGTAGMSEVKHRIDSLDGRWVVQSQGEAMSTTLLRNPYAGQPCEMVEDAPIVYRCIRGLAEGITSRVVPEYAQIEIEYGMKYSGVAVVDPELGFITERVWSVTGYPHVSSSNAFDNRPYLYSGRLRML